MAGPSYDIAKNAVQLAVPISDDGELMSGVSGGSGLLPDLKPSTYAVHPTAPIGDDVQLMSFSHLWPARPSYGLVQMQYS